MEIYENLSLEDLPNEEWRDVQGFPNYAVSNFARVKRLKYIRYYSDGRVRHNEEMIVKQTSKDGYKMVRLFNEKTGRKGVLVKTHRLVAIAFIPNPENKPYIDHINTIRDDNRIENLRWVTQRENVNNPITRKKNSESSNKRFLRDGEREKISKSVKRLHQDQNYRSKFLQAMQSEEMREKRRNSTCCKKVGLFDKNGVLVNSFRSSSEAAKYVGISQVAASRRCINKYIEKGTNITWRYIDG